MAAAAAASKRRRVLASVGLATNQRQLARLLKTLRETDDDDGVVLGSSREQLKFAVDELWAKCGDHVDLEVSPGVSFKLPILDFGRTLRAVVNECATFRDMLSVVWSKRPCTARDPYHLVLYGDEFTPGNVLRQDNARKELAFQVSVREFGSQILKMTAAWLPVTTVRHSVCREIEGAESYVFRQVLTRWFIDADLRNNGVVVELPTAGGNHVVLFFALGNVIADGDALRFMFDLMGARGKLPCTCLNVVNQADELPGPGFVRLDCRDPNAMVFATNADIREKVGTLRLNHGGAGIGQFRKLQTALGMRWNPKGAVFDPRLERFLCPVDVITFDSMHILLSDGVAQDLLTETLLALSVAGAKWDELNIFMQADWRFCNIQKSGGRTIRTAFNRHREAVFADRKTFKCGASEALAILPIFGHYLERVAIPKYGQALQRVFDAFRAFCCIVALVKEGKCNAGLPDVLLRAVQHFMEAFEYAFPGVGMKPKSHWLFHVINQLKRDNFIMDCFVGERLNRVMKACAQQVTTDRDMDPSFEETVLKRSLVSYFAAIEETCFFNKLHNPTRCDILSQLVGASAQISLSMTWMGSGVSKGDLVILDGDPCSVEACVVAGDRYYIVGTSYEFVEQVTGTATRWRATVGAWKLLLLEENAFRYAVTWYHERDTVVVLTL